LRGIEANFLLSNRDAILSELKSKGNRVAIGSYIRHAQKLFKDVIVC
jgi:hypothetical protein